jgi:beta-lactamase superfamily II metal-dependent hydrolase
MQIQIFNVAHGFCAYLVADTGNTMLIDCAHSEVLGFHPCDYLTACRCSCIERFFVLNYDEDHLSGLPRLRERIPINTLHRNTSVSADRLRAMKLACGPLGPGMRSLLEMLGTYTGPESSPPPDFGNLWFNQFSVPYPTFTDTNNLSLVLFLHCRPGFSIVFPGDLERAGWLHLLEDAAFRSNLNQVNIFIASHHGRQSGYVPEVFNFCKPDVVVISDSEMQYDTQEHCYGQHARGINWNETETRHVLSTRQDGSLTITNRPGGFYIQASN